MSSLPVPAGPAPPDDHPHAGGGTHVDIGAETGLTAFPGAESALRAHCAGAALDAPSFARRLARCDLARCRGMCCYDGVYVDEDTGAVLARLAVERRADFQAMGLALPDRILVTDRWRPSPLVSDQRTAVREFPFAAVVAGYPAHFRQTACVFMLEDGRCGLQVLSEKDGRHPWFYKPIPCWLHPIAIGETGITVHDEETDPFRFPWYDGYVTQTFCGRTVADGARAADVLAEELSFLQRIMMGVQPAATVSGGCDGAGKGAADTATEPDRRAGGVHPDADREGPGGSALE
jgi:hypothetical protein